ncbi:hypothetical protein BGW38_002553, partial [Lunasporangiospora selenospora]
HLLDYDRYSIILRGKRTLLLSGLYVLAAPGPYICAETQAGGLPIWLVNMRQLRLRHMKTHLWKEYDPDFMQCCIEYFEHILPILARHQFTNSDGKGCILALQIENESFERLLGYPIGLHEDMRVLSKTARDCGITLPLFTNDGFEQGSFIVRDNPGTKFGIDLYGFDKYVESEMDSMEKKVRAFGHAASKTPIFIPELQGGWFNHYEIKYGYDAIYKFYGDQYTKLMLDTAFSQGCTMLNFYMFYGGTNWGTLGDADVYTSYDYSACIRESGIMSGRLRNLRLGILFLQSFTDITAATLPVSPSNKKNWTVRSSLDNTICQQRRTAHSNDLHPIELTIIRNFSKERQVRFELSVFDQDTKQETLARLSCHVAYKSSFIALGNYGTKNPDIHLILSATPIYVRAFTEDNSKEVWIAALAPSGPTEMAFRGPVYIKEVGGGNTQGTENIQLHQRESSKGTPISVVSVAEGTTKSAYVVLAPTLEADPRTPSPVLHIIFLNQKELSTLYCHYDNRSEETQPQDHRPAYDPRLVTWGSYNARYDPAKERLEVDATASEETLHFLSFSKVQISPNYVSSHPTSTLGSGLYYKTIPLSKSNHDSLEESVSCFQSTQEWIREHQAGLTLHSWQRRRTDFEQLEWQTASYKLSGSTAKFTKVNFDYGFTSGHILYRGFFKTQKSSRGQSVQLKLNMRNRVAVYVNGICIGTHMTYSRQLFKAGAKMGYDPKFQGTHTFKVPDEALHAVTSDSQGQDLEHKVVLVVDSFGLSRSPFVVDDIRNPRGLLSASIEGPSVVQKSVKWEVAGVDVRTLDMAYESTGFPDEHSEEGWEDVIVGESPAVDGEEGHEDGIRKTRLQDASLNKDPFGQNGVIWWKTWFNGPPSMRPQDETNKDSAKRGPRIPLYCRLEGEFSAMILLNGVLIGRYFGSDSPQQDFYLMDGLVHGAELGQVNELKLMIYGNSVNQREPSKVNVLVRPWWVEDAQGSLGKWTGNLAQGHLGEQSDSNGKADADNAASMQAGPFWTFRWPIETHKMIHFD